MNTIPSNAQMTVHPHPLSQYDHPAQHTSSGARDLIQILLKRKRWIIVTAAIVATLAAFYAFSRERNYQATTQILIDPRGVQVVDRELTPRNESADGGVAIVESQMRVLTSNTVLSRVIDEENLTSDPEFTADGSGMVAALRRLLGALTGGGRPSDPQLKVLHKLQEQIRTSRPKRSYIIDLHVKAKDPEKSAHIANAIANTYLLSEAEQRSGLAGRASDMLTSRLGELKESLNQAEDAVERYKVENNILSSSGSLINEQELTQSNQLLVQTSGKTSSALAKLEQIRALQKSGQISNSLPEAVSSSTVMRLRDRYAAARQRQEALSAQLLPSHPRMQALRAEVESARALVNSELRRIADVAQTEYDRAVANQKKIEAQIDGLKTDAFKTKDAMVKLRELQRDADSKRAVYESFLVRARELGEQQRLDTSAARIVSPAVTPLNPAGPNSLLIVALGLIAGCGLGTILAFGREAVDVASPEPGGSRAAPAVPNTSAPAVPNTSAPAMPTTSGLPVLGSIPVYPASPADNGLPAFVAENPSSPSTRAVEEVLDNLRPAGPGSGIRTILVTAPGDNHGKTTVALNLALAAAWRGEKVLLIDGDLDGHALSSIRLGNPQDGWSNVVAGTARLQDVLVLDKSRLIMTLPAGSERNTPFSTPLTASKIVESVIQKLPEVSLIVIDGPAVGGRNGTMVPLSECADLIFLVTRSGETDGQTLEQTVTSLNGHREKCAGSVVVTDAA